MRWVEMKCKCKVWGVKSAMWSVRKVFAWRCIAPGRARVMFLDSNTATASHKARTHGPGWRTAIASSLVVALGSGSWKLRWHMRRDEMRRDELGKGEKSSDEMKCGMWKVQREVWGEKSEVWSVKCGVWSVKKAVRSEKCEVWTVKCERWSVKCGVLRVQCEVKCGVRRAECEVWSVKCGVWSVKSAVKCGLWSVKRGVLRVQCEVQCGVRRVQCEVWSVECGVWRVQWEVWSAKWSCKCDMWNRTQLSQNARTHGLGWRTAHASSIDEKGVIYIYISLRQLPPRLVRVRLVTTND